MGSRCWSVLVVVALLLEGLTVDIYELTSLYLDFVSIGHFGWCFAYLHLHVIFLYIMHAMDMRLFC